VVSAWLWQSGMPLWIVPIFLFAVLVLFVTLTRAVVEGGVPVIRAPLMPADFVISGFGTQALGAFGIDPEAAGVTFRPLERTVFIMQGANP